LRCLDDNQRISNDRRRVTLIGFIGFAENPTPDGDLVDPQPALGEQLLDLAIGMRSIQKYVSRLKQY